MRKKKPKKLLTSFKKRLAINISSSYFQINLIFAGIIIAMLIYSGIFSATGIAHPVKSATAEPTISTGLSRAFSEIVRLNFSQATQYNPYALSIFMFFAIQLLMRINIMLVLLSTRISIQVLIISDILASLLLFFVTYYKFIADQF